LRVGSLELLHLLHDKRTKAYYVVGLSTQISWMQLNTSIMLEYRKNHKIIKTKWKNELKINVLPPVILPLISSGSFLTSDNAAIGIPQFAIGPQKWVLK